MKNFLKLNYLKIIITIIIMISFLFIDRFYVSNISVNNYPPSYYIDFPISIISYIFRKICSGVSDGLACFNWLYPVKIIFSLLTLLWKYVLACFIYWIFSHLRSNHKKTTP